MSKYRDEWPAYERKPEPEGFLILGTTRPNVVGICVRWPPNPGFAIRHGPFFYRRMKRHSRMIHEKFIEETQRGE